MNKNKKFCVCSICGNLVEMIENRGPKLSCCGKIMDELQANTQEASNEKHIPVIKVDNDTINIEVGSVLHPMTNEHYIGWIYIVTNKGRYYKELNIDSDPIVQFKINENETLLEAYAYCNLHGLWKSSI